MARSEPHRPKRGSMHVQGIRGVRHLCNSLQRFICHKCSIITTPTQTCPFCFRGESWPLKDQREVYYQLLSLGCLFPCFHVLWHRSEHGTVQWEDSSSQGTCKDCTGDPGHFNETFWPWAQLPVSDMPLLRAWITLKHIFLKCLQDQSSSYSQTSEIYKNILKNK